MRPSHPADTTSRHFSTQSHRDNRGVAAFLEILADTAWELSASVAIEEGRRSRDAR